MSDTPDAGLKTGSYAAISRRDALKAGARGTGGRRRRHARARVARGAGEPAADPAQGRHRTEPRRDGRRLRERGRADRVHGDDAQRLRSSLMADESRNDLFMRAGYTLDVFSK